MGPYCTYCFVNCFLPSNSILLTFFFEAYTSLVLTLAQILDIFLLTLSYIMRLCHIVLKVRLRQKWTLAKYRSKGVYGKHR